MSKKLLISLVAIMLIGGGIFFALVNNDNVMHEKTEPTGTTQTTTTQQNTNPVASPPTTTSSAGKYIDYSDGIIAKTSGIKLLFFHAPWCPQCQALELSILDKGVPEGVTIIKIDYDSNQSLRQKYGVTIQTTLVKIDDSGNKIASYVAYDEPSIDSVKANLL